MSVMEKPKYKPEHILMKAIDFTEDDLEINRFGYLSETQRARLSADAGYWLVLAVAGAAGCLVVSLRVLMDSTGSSDSKLLLLMFGGIGAAGAFLYGWFRRKRFRDDLREGEVATVEGRVMLRIHRGSGPRPGYKVAIQDTIWDVPQRVFLAFKNGDPYRIYYAPYSKTLLAAEWLWDVEAQEMSDGKAEIQA